MALGIVSAADVEMRVREDECMRTVRPPAPGPHRALQLPEVVRLILAYAVAQPLDPPPLISGSNKLHIRPNDRWMTHWWLPLLVCKAWYFLGQSLLLHEISWNHEDHIHNSPCGAQLPTDKKGLKRFVLQAPDSWFLHETRRTVLNQTVDSLVLQLAGDDSTRDRASPSSTVVMPDPVRQGGRRPACTLRELSFRGDFTYSGELYRFLTNKTIAQSLTLLELSYAHGHRYFELDITMFFESNIGGGGRSVNRELSMFNDNHGQIIVNNNNNDSNDNNDNNMQYKALILPHLQHLLIERIHLAHVPPEWKPSQPSLLKTLRMSRIKTDNVSLETLLAGLCGPWLEDLEVTMIALPPQEQLTYPTRPYLQNPATLRRIAETCPRLFAVRLQQTLETRAFDALRGIYNYFPTVQQASLVCSKGHLPEISGLYQMTRHLTKLFITTKALQASREIHDFLCSDVAEPLEELYLKGAQYAVNLVMPHAVNSYDADQPLWKCRRLQTLTIDFESHSPEGYVRDYDTDAQSRQLFAFLVTHCPKLRFLDLKYLGQGGSSGSNSSNPGASAMAPETGLCFLSRLPDLERLILRTAGFRCRVRNLPSASSSSSMSSSSSSLSSSLAPNHLSSSSYSSSPSSASSSLIPSLSRSRTPNAQDSTRWLLPAADPSMDDAGTSGGLSSLKLCRRIAKLDGVRGHFGRQYGQGILQSATKDDHSFGGKGHSRWLSGSQLQPQQPHQEMVTGACWRKLNMLMVQYCGFHGEEQVEMEQEARLFGHLMPSVKIIFAK